MEIGCLAFALAGVELVCSPKLALKLYLHLIKYDQVIITYTIKVIEFMVLYFNRKNIKLQEIKFYLFKKELDFETYLNYTTIIICVYEYILFVEVLIYFCLC